MKLAVIVVDMQNDFVLPSGTLPVPGALDIIPEINHVIDFHGQYLTVYTQDWHPVDSKQFEKWPVHCVADTFGAALVGDLHIASNALVVHKGQGSDQDGYSAFRGTGLAHQLESVGVSVLLVCGLCTEFCVRATVLDALAAGFRVMVPAEICAAVDPQAGAAALDEMRQAGADVLAESDAELW